MVRCADGSLYTGITNRLAHRLAAHNAGAGAAYTRARRPVALVYRRRVKDRSTALKAEAAFKALTRADKEAALARALAVRARRRGRRLEAARGRRPA